MLSYNFLRASTSAAIHSWCVWHSDSVLPSMAFLCLGLLKSGSLLANTSLNLSTDKLLNRFTMQFRVTRTFRSQIRTLGFLQSRLKSKILTFLSICLRLIQFLLFSSQPQLRPLKQGLVNF